MIKNKFSSEGKKVYDEGCIPDVNYVIEDLVLFFKLSQFHPSRFFCGMWYAPFTMTCNFLHP